jgi:glutathione synthase/RimK-type ligase-like ATP-grasp enzyme
MTRRVGLLVGRERSFPDALIAEVKRREAGVVAEYAAIDATRLDQPPPYSVLVDRISHDVTCYQPVLKLAALAGTYVINDPFWRIADNKFFNAALARRLGIHVPRTVLLPSREYGPDVSAESLRNLRLVDWEGIAKEFGFPMFMKPHWGGGGRDVHRITSMSELIATYNRSGRLTMMLQQEIRWQQYVRCLVIGREHVRPALWDPRRSHHERYTRAAESMPALSPELVEQVTIEALKLCRALGYDMNTVEFAISDGVPYAIDFMNSAPDLDMSSLGHEHFPWVVEKMADLVISAAKGERPPMRAHWDASV